MFRPLSFLLALALSLASAAGAQPLALDDDTGRPVRLDGPARRIVSLAPHLTEMLAEIGALGQVVGVSAHSDYPPEATRLPQVGGYNNLDLEAIAALRPDLIVAWHSGNREAQLDQLRSLGIPVYLNEPRSLDDVARSLRRLGLLAGRGDVADARAAAFLARRDALARQYADARPVRVFYQIWAQPLMTINGRHLISDVIRLCGGENVFAGLGPLSATVSVESVLAANPEVVIASGMGEPRPEWLDVWRAWPSLTATARGQLHFIAPELIQRHSPRILEGARTMCEQLAQARQTSPPDRHGSGR